MCVCLCSVSECVCACVRACARHDIRRACHARTHPFTDVWTRAQVRCFENDDVIHVDGSVDPMRDVEVINLELVLADMAQVPGLEPRFWDTHTHTHSLSLSHTHTQIAALETHETRSAGSNMCVQKAFTLCNTAHADPKAHVCTHTRGARLGPSLLYDHISPVSL